MAPTGQIFDANPAACRILRRSVDEIGHSIIASLEQLEAGERFDVILCDVMLPDLGGPAFFQLGYGFAPEQAARIIFMIGAASSSSDWAFLEGTALPTLRKPFVLQAARDAVRAMVGCDPAAQAPPATVWRERADRRFDPQIRSSARASTASA